MNEFHPEKIKEVKYFLMQVLDLTCSHTSIGSGQWKQAQTGIVLKFIWQSLNHHFLLIRIDIIIHSPLQGEVASATPLPLQKYVTAAASPLPLQRDVAAANPPPQQIHSNC